MRAVNLIPTDQRDQRQGLANRSQGVAYVLLGVLAALALLVFLYGKAHREVSGKEAEAARLEAKTQSVQQQATSLAPYKSFIALREARETAIATLVNSRFDWAHTVRALGNVLPPKTTIVSFSGAIGATGGASAAGSAKKGSAGPVSSATPAGSTPTLTLSGCAATQSTVALALTRLRLIDGVSNVELHSSSRSSSGAGVATPGGGASGPCPATYPAFSATVTFEPLPSPPAATTPVPRARAASVAPAAGSGRRVPTPAARAHAVVPPSAAGGAR